MEHALQMISGRLKKEGEKLGESKGSIRLETMTNPKEVIMNTKWREEIVVKELFEYI
jgi:hypothetical protein